MGVWDGFAFWVGFKLLPWLLGAVVVVALVLIFGTLADRRKRRDEALLREWRERPGR